MNIVSFIKNKLGVSKKKTVSVTSDNRKLRTRQFNFLITPSLYDRLNEASQKIGKSKSDIANSAISEFLEHV